MKFIGPSTKKQSEGAQKEKVSGDETDVSWKVDFKVESIYEAGEGDDFEVYSIIQVPKFKTAAVYRENLLYVDDVKVSVGL